MSNYDKLKEIDCPITKVFLFTVMGTIITKTKKVDPKASLVFQSERRADLFGEGKKKRSLEARNDKLMTALTLRRFFHECKSWFCWW